MIFLLLGLSAVFAFKQETQLYVYSRGIFAPSEVPQFEIYSYNDFSKLEVTVNRVLDPLGLLRLKPNEGYSALKIPNGIKTVVVRRETVQMDRRYDSVKLGKLEAGLYLIGFAAGQSKGVGIALVTDLGMVVKRTDGNVNVLTVNRNNGQRKTATVYGIEGSKQTQLRTDNNGLGKLKLISDKGGLIVANSGNSWAISRSWWQSYGVEK